MKKQRPLHKTLMHMTAFIVCMIICFCNIVLVPKGQAVNSESFKEPDNLADEATPSDATPSDAIEPYLEIIGRNSVIVHTLADLRWALTNAPSYTTVYLGADIEVDHQGIVIPGNKIFVIIDGTAPDGTRHTLTITGSDYSSSLRVTQYNMRQVTLRNIDIVSNNSYGVVNVDSGLSNAEIIHENITFTGPRAAYNMNGTVRIRNSTYQLTGESSTDGVLADAHHIKLDESVEINVTAENNSVFHLGQNDSTLTVLQNADVTVDTVNSFIYTDVQKPAAVLLESGARLNLTSQTSGFTNANQSLSSFLMAENSELSMDVHINQGYGALRVAQLLQLDPGSSMTIRDTGADGILLQLTEARAQAVFNEPARVFLSSPAGIPLCFSDTGMLSITTAALNTWENIAESAGTAPDHIWNKAGSELLTLTAEYDNQVNQSISHNLNSDDPPADLLDSTTFDLDHTQLMAFGEMALTVDQWTQQSEVISGTAAPGAQLTADYPLNDGSYGTVTGTAGGGGSYSLPIPGSLAANGVITVTAELNDLWIRQKSTIPVPDGDLTILSLPERIDYGRIPIPRQSNTIAPAAGALSIIVSDQRRTPDSWDLTVTATPLTAIVNGRESVIPDAFVFVETETAPQVIGDIPVTAYHSEGGVNGDTEIRWENGEGVLLRLNPGEMYSDVEYTAQLQWTLVSAL